MREITVSWADRYGTASEVYDSLEAVADIVALAINTIANNEVHVFTITRVDEPARIVGLSESPETGS